jgi:hypothetical protein
MRIEEIKSLTEKAGNKFFTPGNMRFANSRISAKTFEGPGGIYFITSEASEHMDRRYSVRRFSLNPTRITTVAWHVFLYLGDAYKHAEKLAAGVPIPEPVATLYAIGGENES